MPEEEFKQLRQTAIVAATHNYGDGIKRIDEIIKEHFQQLTLEQRIRLLYSKAEYSYRGNNPFVAIEILAQAKQLSKDSKDPSILHSYHNITAIIFYNLGLYQSALEHYKQAFEKSKFIANEYFSKQAENNIGLILTKQRQFSEARRYFEQFYQHGIETNSVNVQAVALNNLGELAFEEGNIKLSGDLHRQSWALRQQHNLKLHYSWSLLNLAKVAKAENDWGLALNFAKQALELRNERNVLEQIEPGLLVAEALFKLGEQTVAEEQLKQSLAIANSKQNAEWLVRALQLQAEIYRNKNPELAIQTLGQAMIAQQTLAEQRYDVAIAHSSAELGLMSREAELQENRRKHELIQQASAARQQKLWLGMLATLMILFITLYFVLVIRRKSHALEQSLDHLQRTRRQLVEAEKMASLTSLVSGMAHQLNTPLGIVLTAVSGGQEQLRQLQQKYLTKTLSANDLQQGLVESLDILQLAENSTNRAAKLVQRFKQISAHYEQAEPKPIALRQYLHDVMQELLISFNPSPAVKLQLEGPDLTIVSYQEHLCKVFTALTDNALHHGLADVGQPEISIRWQLLQTDTATATATDGQKLLLRFADNGCGIPPSDGSKIFVPFFSTKLGQGNLGLGLNIVFNTLQYLGGEIELESASTDGRGCTFLITLPIDIRNVQKPMLA